MEPSRYGYSAEGGAYAERDLWGFGEGSDESLGGSFLDAEHVAKGENEPPALDEIHVEIAGRAMAIALRTFAGPTLSAS